MPTKLLKMPYEDRVLREDSLRAVILETGPVGFSLDVRLNYYRGMPLSSVEEFTLRVDGETIEEHLLLFEFDDKLLTLTQVKHAFTDFWSVKKVLRVLVYQGGLKSGAHDIDLTLILRNVYMRFGPGEWGMVDASASRTVTLREDS